MEVKETNRKRFKVIGIVAGVLIVCGVGLAIGLLNRAEPIEESLADTQNEGMTSQEESVASTQIPEPTPETDNDTVESEIDTTLTGDSILSSGLSLREAWAFYNEAKKNNEEMGLSAEETKEFLNNLIFDLGTTLAQLEYSDKAGAFNEQQQVAQNPPTSKGQQPSKGVGRDVDGDGVLDVDANGNIIPGGSFDRNGDMVADSFEGTDFFYEPAYLTWEEIPESKCKDAGCYIQQAPYGITHWIHEEISVMYDERKPPHQEGYKKFTNGKAYPNSTFEFYEDIPKEWKDSYVQNSGNGYWYPDESDAIKRFYDAYGD